MIHFLTLTSLVVPPHRQRKEFNANTHQELVESLQHSAVGLQNALVIRMDGETPVLVSGERRLRAIEDIYSLGGVLKYAGCAVGAGLVPCINVGELSEIDRMEAELQENILRDDLTWQERAAAERQLLDLRTAQALARGEPPPTLAQFAAEVNPRRADEVGLAARGDNIDIVSKNLILSRHLDDPDVMAAKTPKEAFKKLQQKERAAKNADLADRIGRSFSKSRHTLVHGDSEEWVTKQPAEYFDVILTDPPYGMGADRFGDSGVLDKAGHGYDDSQDIFLNILRWFPQETYRVAKADAHLYMFCDLEQFANIKACMQAAGWRVFRTPLIWYKPLAYRTPWVEQGPRRTYECILYAVKGEKKVNKLGDDVLAFKQDDNLGHMAQKPVALLSELLARSAGPGQKVLDLFCGSGSIFVAGHSLQCYITGCEIDAASYGLAAKRLGELS
jgi:site-specific DNA-methyltransferase (adenine-specific)